MAKRSRGLIAEILRTGSICLWGVLIFQASVRYQSADALLTGLLFSGAFPVDKNIDDVLSEGAAFAQSSLFPGAAYVRQKASEQNVGPEELYPTQEDLEAFCEENSRYEMLEDEAERKLEAASKQDVDNAAAAISQTNGTIYERESLMDYQFLINNFYVVDSSTSCDASVLPAETLLDRDLTMNLTGDDPKILIYHTHSQEGFADSVPGDEYGTVVGLGNTLTDILEKKYGVSVYHDKGTYDIINGQLDRSEAYSMALPVVERILEENPSIKVVIDLHRDGVNENTRLVTTVDGKPTAKIMFFNGLCRSATAGTNGYIQNPYMTDNLAFSLQMQLKAAEKYPDFTRRIYLRSYRYNMHVKPRTLLIECGAQTNTVEEVQNAMEPLADILYSVLSGT